MPLRGGVQQELSPLDSVVRVQTVKALASAAPSSSSSVMMSYLVSVCPTSRVPELQQVAGHVSSPFLWQRTLSVDRPPSWSL